MKNWFKRLHILSLQLANTKWGIWILLIFAFADASFFPLPVTTFFLVLLLLNTNKTYNYLFLVVFGTITGALTGYLIGHFAWLNTNGEHTGLVKFLFNNVPGFSEAAYNKIHLLYAKWDYWILCAAVTTPLPYGIFSISSGVFDINIFVFFSATLISQGIKFLFLALVTKELAPEVKKLTVYNWKPAVIVGAVCIALVIIVIKAI
jgi:membrane protein YqaA with SNARE-associated domain